jgi:putative FmdB family regulatory protein
MPIYEYRCDDGHTFEVMRRMADDPLEACEFCDAPVQQVFHPIAVHFKGSGFYNTDYGKRKRGGDDGDGGGAESNGSSGSSGEGPGSSDGSAQKSGDGKSSSAGEGKSSGDSGSKAAKAGSSTGSSSD